MLLKTNKYLSKLINNNDIYSKFLLYGGVVPDDPPPIIVDELSHAQGPETADNKHITDNFSFYSCIMNIYNNIIHFIYNNCDKKNILEKSSMFDALNALQFANAYSVANNKLISIDRLIKNFKSNVAQDSNTILFIKNIKLIEYIYIKIFENDFSVNYLKNSDTRFFDDHSENFIADSELEIKINTYFNSLVSNNIIDTNTYYIMRSTILYTHIWHLHSIKP